MSNAKQFFGGSTLPLGLDPIESTDKYYVIGDSTVNNESAGNPNGDGSHMKTGTYTGAWAYYDTAGTLLWSVLPADINASADRIYGFVWYSATSILIVAGINASTTMYVKEINTDGTDGVINATVTTTGLVSASTSEPAQGVYHKADMTGFYVSGENYIIELDNTFTVLNEYPITNNTGGFVTSELVAFEFASTSTPLDGSQWRLNNIVSNKAVICTDVAILVGAKRVTPTTQSVITYYNGNAVMLGGDSNQCTLISLDTALNALAKRKGVI